MPLKEKLFGNKLFRKIMERRRRGLEVFHSEVGIRLGYEKLLGKGETFSIVKLLLSWGVGEGLSFRSRGNWEREGCRRTLDKIGVIDLVEEKHYHPKKLSMNTWIRSWGKAHASSASTPYPLSCGLIGQRVGVRCR